MAIDEGMATIYHLQSSRKRVRDMQLKVIEFVKHRQMGTSSSVGKTTLLSIKVEIKLIISCTGPSV